MPTKELTVQEIAYCSNFIIGEKLEQMRILLVEDEEKVARFIERGLRAELYNVDIATDGREALNFLKHGKYEAVILDLNLPDISGTEVLRHLRRHDNAVPVLILTARDSMTDKVENFEQGADDYLTKPFSFTELSLRIKALLRRRPAPQQELLQAGDLVLDRKKHEIRRGGRPIELTSKEFSLLEYFMTNAGRVLTRTMIMENVWDQSFEGLTNIVDVYVAQLRKKIDVGPDKTLIRTIRGAGYILKEEGE